MAAFFQSYGAPSLASRASVHTFQQHAPMILSAAIALIFALFLAKQVNEWLQLVREPELAVDQSSQPAGVAPDIHRIEALFGAAQAQSYASDSTASDLTLLGSFVHADPSRSTAIIQISGATPQLYRVNEELESGTSLTAVHPDRVEIQRGGRIESVLFPSARSPSAQAEELQEYSEPADMNQLDPQAELLQQQMEALRLQMEGANSPPETTPSDESPLEDD